MSKSLSVLQDIGLDPDIFVGEQTNEPLPVPADWKSVDATINPWEFSFPMWFEAFRSRTIQSTVIPLNKEFVEYLLEDGIDIPDEVYNLLPDSDPSNVTFHPDIIKAIHAVLAKYDAKAFAKLNWTSPKDGAWLSHDRSLQCSFVRDVITLLKGSAKCAVTNLIDYPERASKAGFEVPSDYLAKVKSPAAPVRIYEDKPYPFAIVLRKWSNLYPSREFRVFVAHKRIVAVSQRDLTMYDDLQSPLARQRIRRAIADSHVDHVADKFPHSHYVYDVYVDTKDRVWVVDFHPYSPSYCDGLLFDWDAHLYPFLQESEATPIAYDELKLKSDKSSLASAMEHKEPDAETKSSVLATPEIGPSCARADPEKLIEDQIRDSTRAYYAEQARLGLRHFVVSHPSVEEERELLRKAYLQQRAQEKLKIEQVEGDSGGDDEDDDDDAEWDDWLHPEASFAMRVVTPETEKEGHRISTLQSVLSRLPSDGIDVSDSNAIEKFIEEARQKLKKQEDEDEDESDDAEGNAGESAEGK